MAQGQPAYGPHDGDMSVRAYLDASLGKIYWNDAEEMAKLPRIATGYNKLHVHDVSDLEEATDAVHNAALETLVDPAEMAGLKKQILKYLGAPGCRHVPPPGESMFAAGRVPAFICRRTCLSTVADCMCVVCVCMRGGVCACAAVVWQSKHPRRPSEQSRNSVSRGQAVRGMPPISRTPCAPPISPPVM